jgi:C-terminal processing protease CtpA/Prc
LNGLAIGDVIATIDGKTIKQIIDERAPYFRASNYSKTVSTLNYYNYITGDKKTTANITIQRDGKEIERTVARYTFDALHFRWKVDTTKWKEISPGIGYVNLDKLLPNEIDDMFHDFRNTKALILDLRNYPNSTADGICEYLYKTKMPAAKMTYANLDYPGTFVWYSNMVHFGPTRNSLNQYHYTGRIVILVNELTQSGAEFAAMAYQVVPGAITIGRQTSGADGGAPVMILVGNYQTRMTSNSVFYPDGTRTQRVGVKIDITVNPTVESIKQGKDEILEKALEILQE